MAIIDHQIYRFTYHFKSNRTKNAEKLIHRIRKIIKKLINLTKLTLNKNSRHRRPYRNQFNNLTV